MTVAVSALLERDAETAGIDAALTMAASGAGQVIVLQGPAGIGKSRLVSEAETRARRAGMTVLRARGDEMERDFTFGVARQLFEPALAALGPDERAAALAGAAGLAAPVIGMGDEPATLEVGDRLFPVMHGMYWLCANLATVAPLSILIDDAQWADEQSQQWLAYVARRLGDVATLVVLGVRVEQGRSPSRSLAAIADEPCAHTFELAPLGPGAVARFIGEQVGVEPLPEVVRVCHRRCAGNPFVLRELAVSLVESGVRLDRPESAEQVSGILPDTVARGVLRRLARLDDSAVALARAVAVLGTDVPLVDATRLAELGDDAGAEAMDALVASGFLVPETPLRFVHPLMREAIYGDLPTGRRRYQHRRAAEVLGARIPPEMIGAHLLECEPKGDQYSVAVLRRCGARRCRAARPTQRSGTWPVPWANVPIVNSSGR